MLVKLATLLKVVVIHTGNDSSAFSDSGLTKSLDVLFLTAGLKFQGVIGFFGLRVFSGS